MTRTLDHIVETHRIARDRVAAGKPVWAHTVRVARAPDASFEVNRDNTVRALRGSSWLRAAESDDPLTRLSDLVDELADAERVEEFDIMLDEVYDIADFDRCSIQFVRS